MSDPLKNDFRPGDTQTHQANKALVLAFQTELEHADLQSLSKVVGNYTSSDHLWHGVFPFEDRRGADAVVETFYRPFFEAWDFVQRRQDVFLAGTSVFGGDWVVSMGHFMGLFERPWLDIPATGRLAFLRYCEFHEVRDGRVAETYFLADLIGVMKQAGVNPLPMQTGAEIIVPGPRTHDGLVLEPQEVLESVKTLELIERMARDLSEHKDVDMSPAKLAETWHEDMVWYGPSGVGSTLSIGGFKRQHQTPFRRSLYSTREHRGHKARLTEGVYGGWVGWPSLSMTVTGGGYLGLPATNTPIDMRVVDIYRRAGDKLAENWVFIDTPYTLKQQGLDIFERLRELVHR